MLKQLFCVFFILAFVWLLFRNVKVNTQILASYKLFIQFVELSYTDNLPLGRWVFTPMARSQQSCLTGNTADRVLNGLFQKQSHLMLLTIK